MQGSRFSTAETHFWWQGVALCSIDRYVLQEQLDVDNVY